MKIVINTCYGGFGLSRSAVRFLSQLQEVEPTEDDLKSEYLYAAASNYRDEARRTDPDLIRTVETLGDMANGRYSNLTVLDLRDDLTEWYISDYDGLETVYECYPECW